MGLLLTATDQSLELVTSTVTDVDWSTHWLQHESTGGTHDTNAGNIQTAATTEIVAAPAVSKQRQIQSITVKNKHASSVNITIRKKIAANSRELYPAVSLAQDESIEVDSEGRLHYYDADGKEKLNTSTFTLSDSVIDMSTTSYVKVIDDDIVNTLIADTTKPASPQWTHTVTAGEIPTDTAIVEEYMILFCIGGFNNNASTRTLNIRATVNGVDIGSSDTAISTSGLRYWAFLARQLSVKIQAGDVVGFKMWGSVTNDLDYRYATIYIIPRKFLLQTKMFYSQSGIMSLSGAISGVTYVSNPITTYYAAQDVGGTSRTFSATDALLTFPNQFITPVSTIPDGSATSTGVQTMQALYQLTNVIRYLKRVILP